MKLWCKLCNSGFHVAITAIPAPPFCPACQPQRAIDKKHRPKTKHTIPTKQGPANGTRSPS